MTQIFPVLVTGSSFSGSQDPLTYPQHYVLVFAFSSTSLLPRTTRSSRIVLHIFCSSHRINHFSKEPWFLLLENVIRDQDLGNKCNHCYQSILSRHSQLTEQHNIWSIQICAYIPIYKYIQVAYHFHNYVKSHDMSKFQRAGKCTDRIFMLR